MFGLIFKIGFVFLLHVILYSCYPETGKNGNLVLGISLFLSASAVVMVSTLLKPIAALSGFLSLIINIVTFAFIGACIAYTIPQTDKVSVFDKIRKGNFSNYSTFRKGLERFGINWDETMDKAGKVIKEQKTDLEKEVKNIKVDSKMIKELQENVVRVGERSKASD